MNHSLPTGEAVPFFDDDIVCERAVDAGIDRSCATAVLLAQFRYLLLIGAIDIDDSEVQARVARERVRFAPMIVRVGDLPLFDHDDEHDYVVATTGLDDDTVGAVLVLVRVHEHEIGVIARAALQDFVARVRSRLPTRAANC